MPEVLDCWFESGSMPYAQLHYPFENKEFFESGFPAKFIAEGQDQTRGWFYTLHVLATALTRGETKAIPASISTAAFQNVIVNGIVLAEDGKKMSKRLKNYPEPDVLLEKYGADAVRYYLATSPVMEAEALNFSEAGVREVYGKVINTLWNVVEFFELYADATGGEVAGTNHALDRWILAKLQTLICEVGDGMQAYELVRAARPIGEFITELSQWYVRRSRDRFKGGDVADKQAAVATLRYVLLTLAKVMAPFMPFMAEKIYRLSSVGGELESVHLELWPNVTERWVDEQILSAMNTVRVVVEMGLALRAEHGRKVRQPLAELVIGVENLPTDLQIIIAEELNVKKVRVTTKTEPTDFARKEGNGITLFLDITLTPELKAEGLARDMVRAINQLRKDQGLTIKDNITVRYASADALVGEAVTVFGEQIMADTLTHQITADATLLGVETVAPVTVGEATVYLQIEKIM